MSNIKSFNITSRDLFTTRCKRIIYDLHKHIPSDPEIWIDSFLKKNEDVIEKEDLTLDEWFTLLLTCKGSRLKVLCLRMIKEYDVS